MRRQIIALSLGVGALLLATQHAFAEGAACASRDRVLKMLAERHGETRQVIALTQTNNVLEVFASTETGSWTIIVTRPTGETCLIGSGRAFELTGDEPAPPQGEKV